MTDVTDHAGLVRLGAAYLRAYAAQDAVALYHLTDRWDESDLRTATCELALTTLCSTIGAERVDAFCAELAGAGA